MLTSTYPRWAGDTEPAFVHALCRKLATHFDIRVIAPHAPGAACSESLDGVQVFRFRYLPERWETLAYGGGIPARLRLEPWRLVQVPCFVAGLLCAAWSAVRDHAADIIHAHWVIPQGLVAAIVRGGSRAPALVCTAHGADLFIGEGFLGRFLKRWALRRVQTLTVVSRAMVEPALALGVPKEAVEVASMGADLETCFVPGDEARMPGRILFAGRLVEKKGVNILLEAFARVRTRRPELRLVIAGDGPERARLQLRAAGLGIADDVEFAGAVPAEKLAALFRSSAMAVFPFIVAADGDREGFGLVVIEAQGCACPVIASDLPAVRDSIVDGETGLLTPSGDAVALADRIDRLLEDTALAHRIALNGRRAAAESFGWDAVAERYCRILLDARARTRER